MKNWEILFLGLFILTIGVLCLWVWKRLRTLKNEINKWEKVTAVVAEKFVDDRKYLPGTDIGDKRVYLTYSFIFQGKEFSGNRLDGFELMGIEQSMMLKMAQKRLHGIRDEVFVFVDPSNPERNCVRNVSMGFVLLYGTIGWSFTLFGSLMLISLWE